ncbi:MAG: hypothetical protein ACXW36_02015 [Nitrospira sp.]
MPRIIIKEDCSQEQQGEYVALIAHNGWTREMIDMRPSSLDGRRKWLRDVQDWCDEHLAAGSGGIAEIELGRLTMDFEAASDALAFKAALKDGAF